MNNHEIKNQGAASTCVEQKAEGTVEIKTMLQVLFREIQEVRVGVRHLGLASRSNRPGQSEPHGPPASDNEATRVFALVRSLDAGDRTRKAPLHRVFRLYCMEAKTVKRVARECACSRALVFRRLDDLRQKLGRDPVELRVLASNFEAFDDSLQGPRRH
jgi:hypothetical protein